MAVLGGEDEERVCLVEILLVLRRPDAVGVAVREEILGCRVAAVGETLEEAQAWYVFCVNPNDSQLPNQLEGRSVKGQVRSLGLAEVARRNVNVFEVAMTPEEFVERYGETLVAANVHEGEARERAEQTRTALGLEEKDIVLGMRMVSFSRVVL